jgi:hypothetical protein
MIFIEFKSPHSLNVKSEELESQMVGLNESADRTEAQEKQNKQDQGEDQWADNISLEAKNIAFACPEIMEDVQPGRQKYQPVQSLPVLSQPDLGNIKRSYGKGQQDQECDRADNNERSLPNICKDQSKVCAIIQEHENGQVDGCVHESIQPQRAAMSQDLPPAKQAVQRRAGQAQNQKSQGSPPGALL